MTAIDLDLQMKFLNELDDALADALKRYVDDSPEKLDELSYMRSEVKRARRIVSDRMTMDAIDEEPRRKSQSGMEMMAEAAVS